MKMINNIKYIVAIFGCFIFFQNIEAQQLSLFSNYTQDHFSVNPAAVNHREGLAAHLIYRNQWTGFDGAPVTTYFDVYSPIRYSNWGIGGSLFTDKIGGFQNLNLQFTPGYNFELENNLNLSLALGINYLSMTYNIDELNTNTGANDLVVQNYIDGIGNFNINPSFYLNNNKFFVGLSIPQIAENNNVLGGNDNLDLEFSRRQLMGLIGGNFDLNENWKLSPSLLGRFEAESPANFDLNALLNYKDLIALNVGYRSSGMLITGITFNINNSFNIGYTHDANLGSLSNKAPSSHEVLLGYYKVPEVDTDKDGIIDRLDECPNEKGSIKFNGCANDPNFKDADGDGIEDYMDDCPNEFGVKEENGCPEKIDSDGDGILDKYDKCPTMFGLAKNFGCPEVEAKIDSDNDGIYDEDDKCPNKYGLKSNNGCPDETDTDGDGIIDSEDKCPNTFGIARNYGCPAIKDSDNDGVPDNIDRCPNTAGSGSNEGCPTIVDSDGDGIRDNVDECPNIYGYASTNGCPTEADSDNDGVADSKDRCPNTFGAASNWGCPVEIDSDGDGIPDSKDTCPYQWGSLETNGCPGSNAFDSVLSFATENITFETGSNVIKTSSYESLDQIVNVLIDNPGLRLRIAGHTDDVGNAATNLNLSRKRAEAVRDYLVDKGISYSNCIVEYFGETKPKYDNATSEGRKKNRRVEFEIMY